MSTRLSRWLVAGVIAVVVALAVIAGAGSDGGSKNNPEASTGQKSTETNEETQAAEDPKPKRYRPDQAEEFPNAKRLASRVVEQALTYEPGQTSSKLSGSLPSSEQSRGELASILEPLVDPAKRSFGEVVYPQLSGVTDTTFGAMVLARQFLVDPNAPPEATTRVFDVRLRLAADGWRLARIASVGGSAVERPESLPTVAKRVLDNPNITLSDSARWDIHRGVVDKSLLRALADAARGHSIFVGVLQSGHPENVWETDRISAHTRGFAADIFAVDGKPIIRQRGTASPAYALAESLYAGGAAQLGSPWVFTGGGSSFTDPVHQDHLHLQQSPIS